MLTVWMMETSVTVQSHVLMVLVLLLVIHVEPVSSATKTLTHVIQYAQLMQTVTTETSATVWKHVALTVHA
jgi:hypothetical protein